ncbi:hypothetical protein HNV11_11985 [Spirosoma taeanense]|uniref:Fibronectin type-III domain-containing protein n=1 Tax=Spirosoma taeanense TaxID=2735870 RepID=A0A6M5Y9Y9_9BACT|nr:fibronectin type III domain-containing protein [Spirosoma taeanense]QJW90041.1 hypothetical protein HNV11_11985 [Spirosoma taeanense]
MWLCILCLLGHSMVAAPGTAYSGVNNTHLVNGGAGAHDHHAFFLDCEVPYNPLTYEITAGSAHLYWYNISYSNVTWDIQYRVVGTPTWTTISGLTSSNFVLMGLANNTTYEWQVRTNCSGESSAFTASTSFTTQCQTPGSPFASDIKAVSAKLNWTAAAPNQTYAIQYRVVGTSNWTVMTEVLRSSFTVSDLVNNTTYEWQVKTVCSATESSTYTAISQFTTQCRQPSGLTTDLVAAHSARLNWNSDYSASPEILYDLQWQAVGDANWTTVSGLTSVSYSLSGLTNGRSYQWRVRSRCSAADNPNYTAPVTFNTLCANTASLLNVTSVMPSAASLSWYTTDFSAKEPYVLQWRSTGATTWNSVSPVTSPYSLTGLSNNTTYEWQIANGCTESMVSTPTASVTFTTQCSAPSEPSTANISSTQARLNWFPPYYYGPSTSYELRWRVVGTSVWNTVTNLTGTTYLLSSLTNGASYEWQIKTLCSAQESSEYTALTTFATQCTRPTSPSVNAITSTSARLNWSGPGEGVTFMMNWRVQGTTTWNVVSDIPTTSVDLDGLVNATTYEWRVQTVCPGGGNSTFSSSTTFVTQCTNAAYAFKATAIIPTGATLSWYGPTEGTLYDIRWRPLGTTVWNTVSNYVPTTTSLNLTNLTNATTYEWQVRTVCRDGQGSVYGPLQTFTTQCQMPMYLTAMGVTGTSVSLNWAANGNPPDMPYQVQWRVQGIGADWNTANPSNPSFLMSGLTPNTTYEWRVRTQCSSTTNSSFADVVTFSTTDAPAGACTVPVSLTANNLLPTGARLSWIGSATGYEIRYRLINTDSWTVVPDLTSSGYEITGLLANTTYEWQVKAACSDYSASAYFQTQCALPTATSTTNITASGARFNWSGGNGGGLYEIQYRVVNTPDWTTVGNLSTTYYEVAGLSNTTSYEWRVRRVCSATDRPAFTPSITFMTSCRAPTNPYVSETGSTSAELDWSGTGDSFEVRWRPTGSSTWTTDVNMAATEHSLTSLTPDTQYEWQVRQRCGANSVSAYTGVEFFRTRCSLPVSPVATELTASTVRLSWAGAGDTYDIQWRLLGTTAWTATGSFAGKQYVLTGLTDNSVYEWQVRSVCTPTSSSAFTTPSTFQTGCRQPYNLVVALQTSNSAQLSWSGGGADITYEIQWRVTNTPGWTTISNLIQPAYRLSGLPAKTTVEWQVRTVCSATSNTAFVGGPTFQTQCALPAYQRTDFVSPKSAQLSWGPVADGNFELQWRVAGGMNWNSVKTTRTLYSLTGLTIGTTYEWRVRTLCSPTDSSAFIGPVSFTTQCSSPSALTTSNVGPGSAVLNWTGPTSGEVPDSTITYEVNWRAQGNPAWTVVRGLTTTTYALTGLTSGTVYEWTVRTSCLAGDNSLFAPSVTFSAQCLASVASVQVSSVSAGSASLTWGSGAPGTYTPNYDLRWRVQGSATWTTVSSLTSTAYSLTGLANNTRYEAQVQGICSDGQRTDFSRVVTFRTACVLPAELSTTAIGSSSARVNWSTPVSATYVFDLRWRPVGSADWTTAGLVTSGYALTGLTNNTLYEWQIRTGCNPTNITVYSAPQIFRTRCTAPAGTFTSSITGNSAQLNWTNFDGASMYEVRWRAVGTSTWSVSGSLTSSPYTLTGLSVNSWYEWQVRTICSDGQPADFSPLLRFLTTDTVVCTSMFTLKNGDWNDVTVWSCGRLPNSSDPIRVKHTVSLPAGYVGNVQQVSLDVGGRVNFGLNARLRMNP